MSEQQNTARGPAAGSKLVLKYAERRVLVRCPASYAAAVAAARAEFSIPREQAIALHINLSYFEPGSDVGDVEISPGSWDLLAGVAATPVVVVRLTGRAQPHPASAIAATAGVTQPQGSEVIDVTVVIPGAADLRFKLKRSQKVGKLFAALVQTTGVCQDSMRLIFLGERLMENDTFEGRDVCDGDEIYLYVEHRGGKPVIYLQSPAPLSASVQLSLVPQWRFSAIYPVAPKASKSGAEAIAWHVDVRADGTLHDRRTGSDVAYLYWEATTLDGRPRSPAPEGGPLPFDPAHPDIRPSNAVVLGIADVPAYLDTALKGLALHVEARTSFITYWLPALLKHAHIALRFLPQAAYERAAPLAVTPAPDVVTRVFMLFRGVADEDVEGWRCASVDVGDAEYWPRVVGVDAQRAGDAALFRVLEWGGMEV